MSPKVFDLLVVLGFRSGRALNLRPNPFSVSSAGWVGYRATPSRVFSIISGKIDELEHNWAVM